MIEGAPAALAGIFKSRYLKRFESSVEAFRISIRRALAFLKTFQGCSWWAVLESATFQDAIRYLERRTRTTRRQRSRHCQWSRCVRSGLSGRGARRRRRDAGALESLPELQADHDQVRQIEADLSKDIEMLTRIWDRIEEIEPEQDAKLQR